MTLKAETPLVWTKSSYSSDDGPSCVEVATTPAPPEQGHVTFLGAGPGDPGLLTLRAVEALANADV
ncbi:DUF397 domain-containing protein, partial [Streptomyces griseorubens]|uniref:DUF397 domain-containing protein n=1 Tax=Streptomyces griseorubens TaxID=66897 RepID=UPI003511400E